MRGGIGEIIVIVLIIGVILLITGGKKIPEVAKSLKKGKDILTEDDEKKNTAKDESDNLKETSTDEDKE